MAWIDDGDGGWQEVPPLGSEPRPVGRPPSGVAANDAANGVIARPSAPLPAPSTPGMSLTEADRRSRGNAVQSMKDDILARNTAGDRSNQLYGQIDTSGQVAPQLTPAQRLALAGSGRGGAFTQPPVAPASGARAVTPTAPSTPFTQLDETTSAPPSKVEKMAGQARDAVGPAPTVDMGLADRGYGAFQESLDMSREVLDRLLNAPSVTKAIGDQALSSQLAIARSARGGPGAVASAMDQAQAAAPGVTQQAALSASSEELARTSAAGQVASSFAQAALGGRQQDIGVATANQNAAVNVMQQVTALTGTQLNLDQQNQELIGQMARDFASLDYNWAALSYEQQNKEFDRWVTVYGIDKNFAAQIKAISASKQIGPMDVFNGIVGVLGAGATVTTAALKK